jgi:hypothetical protein
MILRLPEFEYDGDGENYDRSVELSTQFIESQQELTHFTLRESQYSSAISKGLMHQRSSLQHVEFTDTVFDEMCSLDWLPYCKYLKSLSFVDSEALTLKVLFPLYNSPLKHLSSLLFHEDPVPVYVLEKLINSSKHNLKKIEFGWPENCDQEGYPHILKSISLYCPNLLVLGCTIGCEEISELFSILKCCRELRRLEIYGNGDEFDVSKFLPELGELLPSTLSELNIGAQWIFNSEMFALFFENAKHVPLCEFVIKICDFINDEHLKVIQNHSMYSLKYFTFSFKRFSVTKSGMAEASGWLRKNF